MSEKAGPDCFRSVCFRLFLFGSHLLRVSHKARHFAFLRSFLGLLLHTNMPPALFIFYDLSVVHEPLKNVR